MSPTPHQARRIASLRTAGFLPEPLATTDQAEPGTVAVRYGRKRLHVTPSGHVHTAR